MKNDCVRNPLVGAVHGGGLTEKKAKPEIMEILEMIGLFSQKNDLSGKLSLMNRKALELGRALATRPELLLLDEVAGGLTEAEAELLLKIVKQIQAKGITILWIEHILMMMSEGVDRLLVIDQGRQLASGDPAEVMKSREVLESYLGEEED